MIRKGDISKYSLGEPRLNHRSKRLYFAKNTKDQLDSAIVIKNYFDQDQHYLNSMRTKFSTTQERFTSTQKNIMEIKYWDLVQDPRTHLQNLYLIMEKMKDNLSDIIKERTKMQMFFTESELKKLISDTYNGLQSIQKNRIAHMNLKPSNILMDFDETYKIADLGHPNDMSLPQFLAPELGNLGNVSIYYESSNNGREETFRTDAFSYGAILFQAATLCETSEVEALKVVSSGATNFIKQRQIEITKRYGDSLQKIIKDLTSHTNRKNFKQLEDQISIYLSSDSSQIFSESTQSQFVSQLIPPQNEQSVLKELLEEIYQQKDVNVKQELTNLSVYGSEYVRVKDFEDIIQKALKQKLKRDELSLLVKHYDSGKGDNKIDYVKFCNDLEAPHKSKENTVQDLMKKFYQSFRLYFNSFDEFIAKYDSNKNGVFDYDEMINIYRSWFKNADNAVSNQKDFKFLLTSLKAEPNPSGQYDLQDFHTKLLQKCQSLPLQFTFAQSQASVYSKKHQEQQQQQEWERQSQRQGTRQSGEQQFQEIKRILAQIDKQTVLRLFEFHDEDHDQKLTYDDFKKFILQLKSTFPEYDIKSAFQYLDTSKDNRVSIREFMIKVNPDWIQQEQKQLADGAMFNKANFLDCEIIIHKINYQGKPVIKKTHEFNVILKQIVLTMQSRMETVQIFRQNNPQARLISVQEFRLEKFEQEWENMKQSLWILRQLRQAILDLNLDTVFHTYDVNQDNWLDFTEFSKLVKKISNVVSYDQTQILFSMFDSNNDSKISLDEFKIALEIQYSQHEPIIQQFFKELSMALNKFHQQFETVFQKFVYQNNLAIENFKMQIESLGINTFQNQSYQIVVQELQLPTDNKIIDYPLFRYYYNKYKITPLRILTPDEQEIEQKVSMQISAAMSKNHWTFEQAFGKYDKNMTGSISIQDMLSAITKDLGLPNDAEKSAFVGIIGDEQGKIKISKLKTSVMQGQQQQYSQGYSQHGQALQKLQQQIPRSFNSQIQALQNIMSDWERIPKIQFQERLVQANLLNNNEAAEVANILDQSQTGFVYQAALQQMVFSQIKGPYNSQAIMGVKQIESPKGSLNQVGRVQSIQFFQKEQQQQQQSQFLIPQQPQQPQQPFGNPVVSQIQLQSQQFQPQQPQYPPQQPQYPPQQPQYPPQQPQYPPQQPQYPPQYPPEQPQYALLQSGYPQQQPQPGYPAYPPPQIQIQQPQIQQFQQPQIQQPQIPWQQNQLQSQQQSPSDLSYLKQFIEAIIDHSYELKMLLKDQEVHEHSIQIEINKLEKQQLATIPDIKQLALCTQSYKGNTNVINLPKFLDNCKVLREKNYKIEKDQFSQTQLIAELKEKINNYIRGQQISFRTFFRQIALNNDQQMEHKEFQTGLKKKLGIQLEDMQVVQLFKHIDQNNDFQLSYEEFQNFMQGEEKLEIKPILRKIRKRILRKDGENLQEVFNRIDINKDKRINFEEWRSAMTSLDSELNFDEINALYKHFDKNGQDGINYEHFETIMLEDHMSLKQWSKQIEDYCTRNSLTEQTIFRRFNQQGKDLMSFKEFKQMLEAVDQIAVKSFDNDQYEDIFNIFDQDKDYQISLSEFLKVLSLQQGKGLTQSTTQIITKLLQRVRRKALNQQINLQWELKQYDYNNFNKVRFEEWSRVIKRFCDLAPSELELLFKNFDKDDSNSIDINEFIAQIQNTQLTDDINSLIEKIQQFQRKFNLNDLQFWTKFCKVEGQNWKFEEFTKMMDNIYFQCQKEEKDEYFQNFDFDSDNQISFNDFLSAMKKNFRLQMNFQQFLNPQQNQSMLQQYPNQQPSSFNDWQFKQQPPQQQPMQQQYSFSQQQQQNQPTPNQFMNQQPKFTETVPFMQGPSNVQGLSNVQGQFNVNQVSMRVIQELQQVQYQANRDIFQVFTGYDFKRNFELSSSSELEIIIKGLARMNFQFTKEEAIGLFQQYSKNLGQTMHFAQLLNEILGAKIFIFKGLKYLIENQMLTLNQLIPSPQGLLFEQFSTLIIQFLQIQVNQIELRQVFDSMDQNHNNLLQQNELIQALELQIPNAFSPQQLVQSMKREILNSSRAQQLNEVQLFEVFFGADNSKQFNYSTPNELKLALQKIKIMKSDQEISAFYKFYSRDLHSVNYLKIFSDLFSSELSLRLALLKIIEYQKATAEKLFKMMTPNNLTFDQFFNFCEKIKMEMTRPEANAIYQQYLNKASNKFTLKEFQIFLSTSGNGQAQQFGQSQIIQFEENMFLDERPILLRMAKEMQQNKNILTVADLFKTQDKFVPKQSYFTAITWLGFSQNDNQIISLAKKLSKPDDFTQISLDWFEQALRRLGNLGQHMQQQWGGNPAQQEQQFNWEEQNFLNSLSEAIKETADEIAQAVVEDNVGMYAFKKYDKDNKGKITTRQFDQIIYADLHFEKDQYLDNLIKTMNKNNQVDLKLLEKVLNNKGSLSKFQQKGTQPTSDMYGIGRFNEQSPAKNLSQQEIAKAQQLIEIIKKQCKSEEQINEYFFPLGSPSAINLQMFQEKMNGIKSQVNLKPEQVELLFSYLDASNNGVLTVQEFKLIFESGQATKKNIQNIKITGRLQDEIRTLFQSLDSNNNNSLDQAELSQALQQIGICPNPSELQEYFRSIDLDRNGVIDYTEFSTFMIHKLKEEMISIEEFQQNVRREFRRVDVNKTRQLTRSQMDTLFHNLGYELERQEFEILFQEIDKDQSGLIDIDELIYFLCSNKKDVSETAKMAILNINCAHISVSDLASTFKQLPETFVNSFLRKLNRQGLNLPGSSLKLQLDPTKLYYKDLLYTLPPGIDHYYPQNATIGKPVLRRSMNSEWFEIKINQLTGVPIPEKKTLILGRELKFCLMDTVANFVGNTAKVKAYWSQQYEDRWQFQPVAQQQSSTFFETHMKDENTIIVRLQNNQIDKIQKLIIELIIYIKNQDKVIAISCGWAEIVIKDILNSTKPTQELPIQSGIPANSKALSNVKVQRKGWSKFVQKLSSPIKSSIQFEISKANKFPNDYKDMVNCLPPTIILNKVHLNYFAVYREYIALKMIDPQYNRGGPSLHKSPKVKAFIMGVNSPDFLELLTRFWLKMEQSQQFREVSKQNEDLFRMKIKCFETIQDQAYLLINNITFKYNFADPTYPAQYDIIAKNRNSLYNDFMQTVVMKLTPSRSGQVTVKKELYHNLEPFNTAQLSDDEDDNILLSKFKSKMQKSRKPVPQQSNQQFNQGLSATGFTQY